MKQYNMWDTGFEENPPRGFTGAQIRVEHIGVKETTMKLNRNETSIVNRFARSTFNVKFLQHEI